MDYLQDYLVNEGTPDDFDAVTFIINDDDQALWAMKKLAVAQRRINEQHRLAEVEQDRITRWLEQSTKAQKDTVTYFTNALSSYMTRLRSEGRKTLVLPDGDVSSRSIPAKAAVSDLDVFLKWCDENRPEWIRTKREADLAAMKDHLDFSGDTVLIKQTGEVVDGLLAVEEGISVSIKISE